MRFFKLSALINNRKERRALVKRRNSLRLAFVLVLILLVSGCGSSMMIKAKPMAVPENNDVVVTFIRPSVFGGAIKFGLWDSENFIGILTAKSYVQYKTHPGEHLFIARAENWSYVKANLEPGKQYFILGKVFPGVWKARVALDPVNKNDNISQKQIDNWLNGLTPTTVIPEKVDSYAKPRLPHMKAAIEKFKTGDVKYNELQAADGR